MQIIVSLEELDMPVLTGTVVLCPFCGELVSAERIDQAARVLREGCLACRMPVAVCATPRVWN